MFFVHSVTDFSGTQGFHPGMFARLLLERTEDMAKKNAADLMADLFGDRFAEAISEGRVLSGMTRDEKRAAKKEYDRKRYHENDEVRDRRLAQANQYYADHTEVVKEKNLVHYHANADRILATQKERRLERFANEPGYAERERAWSRNHYAADPVRYKAIHNRAIAKIKLLDPGRNARDLRRRYWADPVKHRERAVMDMANRRNRLLAADGDIDMADIARLLLRQKGKCAFCLKPLGKQTPHLDHYIPLSRGGSNEMSNLRLLHRLCNMRKHAKHPLDFGLENGLLVW